MSKQQDNVGGKKPQKTTKTFATKKYTNIITQNSTESKHAATVNIKKLLRKPHVNPISYFNLPS